MSAIEELRTLVFYNDAVLHGSPDYIENEIEPKDDTYGNTIISGTIIPEVALYYALFRRLPGRMPNGGSWSFVEKDSKYFLHLKITQERLDFILSGNTFKGFVYVLDKKDFKPIGFEECRLYEQATILKKIVVTEKDLPFTLEKDVLEYEIPLPYVFKDILDIKPLDLFVGEVFKGK